MLEAQSPLGLDLYLWLTYRTFALKRPLRLTWRQLYRQFGADPAKASKVAQQALLDRLGTACFAVMLLALVQYVLTRFL